MLCVMMLPLVVVGCNIKAVCQSVREATTASGVDNGPRLADTVERDYFTSVERLITMQKQLKEPRSILMSRQIELPTSGGKSCNYCGATALARFQRSINVKVLKLSNPFTNVCCFCFNNISAPPHKFLAASTVFFCPIPETKK